MSAARLLVLQHLAVEHPGVFRAFLAADGVECHTVELDQGDRIPPVEDYDGLWVMGGPMDVWEEDQHPWLATEKAAIRRAVVELGLPFLGICLGHQLLADALGGEVAAGAPEVGIMAIELTAAGAASPYLAGFPAAFDCLHWHAAEVTRAPAGASVLARSVRCAVQALAVGDKAFSAQFHVEVTAATVDEWSALPAYGSALRSALGAAGASRLRTETGARMQHLNALARRLYDNWTAVAWGARRAAGASVGPAR